MTQEPAATAPLRECRFDAPPDARALRRARWATRGQFMALGIVTGAWGVHIPSVKAHYALDVVRLSLVLFAAACGAIASLFFAGRVVGRLGARGAAAAAGVPMCAGLALVLQWPGLGLLLPSMLLFGAGMSLFDVAINAEGTALEGLSGKRVLSNLHGMFSVGGMLGAACASAMLGAGVRPAVQVAVVALAVAALVALASRAMLQAHPAEDTGEGVSERAHFAWPRGLLLVIGLLIFTGMTAEGVMYDWCVLYLKQELQMPQAQAAIGYAVFSAAMAAARFGGDALRARVAEPRLLAASAGTAAVAMGVVLLAAHPGVALVGFAVVGIGLAPVVPILFNAATRVPGVSRAAAIASVSSVGYAGFMVGPPLIGAIAHASSLTHAMALVALAAALLAVGARKIRREAGAADSGRGEPPADL